MGYLSQIRAGLHEVGPKDEAPDDRRITGRLHIGELGSSLGEVINLSCGGMLVERQGKSGMKPGKKLMVTLVGPVGLVQVPAEVVRLERSGFMRWRIAVKFIDVDDDLRHKLGEVARSSLRQH
ncbi:MAG: PilZ domain-containing protein [Phycisphaeraceae bacterium]|nr:PilZ domain-containing protein [Phycisphaerales bacterium]MCB9861485.1 PilZ domain-containing protein [Phycisphaeraceae bacterium]